MSQRTMVDKTQNQREGISDTALENLTATEDEIETSSQYFKPKPNKVYLLSVNPEEKIEPRLNDRFKDAQGRPLIRVQSDSSAEIWRRPRYSLQGSGGPMT